MNTESDGEKHLWVWDMDSTLKLTNKISGSGMTCVGPTRTGTRCHLKIPVDQHSRVKDMIRDLTRQSPVNTIPYLKELARLSLCEAYHGTTEHVEAKKGEWGQDIELITPYCDWIRSLGEHNRSLQETLRVETDARLNAERELKQRQETDQNAEANRSYQIDECRAKMSSCIESADKARQEAELSLASALQEIDLLRGELENEKQAIARLQQEDASLKMKLDNEKRTSARLQKDINSHTCPILKHPSKLPPRPEIPDPPIRNLPNSIGFDRNCKCNLLNIKCNELQQEMEVQEAAHREVQRLQSELEQAEGNISNLQQRVDETMDTNLRLRSQIADPNLLLADAGFADLVKKLAWMSLDKLVDVETAFREVLQARRAARSQHDVNEGHDNLEQRTRKRRRIESA